MQISDNERIENGEDSEMAVLTVLPEHATAITRIADDVIDAIGCEESNVTRVESSGDDSFAIHSI